MNIIRNKQNAIIQVDNYRVKDYIRYEVKNGGRQNITYRIVKFWENGRHQVFVHFEHGGYGKVDLFIWNGSRLATEQEIEQYKGYQQQSYGGSQGNTGQDQSDI